MVVGGRLAIVIEREAGHELGSDVGVVLSPGLEGRVVGYHLLKFIEITLSIKPIRTLFSVFDGV